MAVHSIGMYAMLVCILCMCGCERVEVEVIR